MDTAMRFWCLHYLLIIVSRFIVVAFATTAKQKRYAVTQHYRPTTATVTVTAVTVVVRTTYLVTVLVASAVQRRQSLRARHTLQLSPIATRNTGPATIAGLPAANPQGLQAVCRAIGRISILARKLQCCSQSQRGISYDPMTHSLSKWEVTDCPARVLLIWNGIARGRVQSCNVCREHCDLDCNLW